MVTRYFALAASVFVLLTFFKFPTFGFAVLGTVMVTLTVLLFEHKL